MVPKLNHSVISGRLGKQTPFSLADGQESFSLYYLFDSAQYADQNGT